MRRLIVFISAALLFCLVPQKVLIFLLPYALKRIGGDIYKRLLKSYKNVVDIIKLVSAFH